MHCPQHSGRFANFSYNEEREPSRTYKTPQNTGTFISNLYNLLQSSVSIKKKKSKGQNSMDQTFEVLRGAGNVHHRAEGHTTEMTNSPLTWRPAVSQLYGNVIQRYKSTVPKAFAEAHKNHL